MMAESMASGSGTVGAVAGKTLAQLYPACAAAGCGDIRVTGLSGDSRETVAGDLFFALPGAQCDGRDFIEQALSAGAAAVFAESRENFSVEMRAAVAVVHLPQLASQCSAIAACFYDDPSAAMTVFAVTGTNGKTTCSHLIASLSQQIDRRCGLIGTLGYGVIGAERALQSTGMTTPDALQLQACMADLQRVGCESVAVEVSSHALVQARADAVRVNIAVLTNLSRDHLDFHQDMAGYAAAKRRLFQFDGLDTAVINFDDEFGRQLAGELAGRVALLSYSTVSAEADIHAHNICYSLDCIRADISTPWGDGQLSLPLMGEFNLSNALAALAALLAAGSALPAVLAGFSSVAAVDGRMQLLSVAGSEDDVPSVAVVVDYAHTPEALALALAALRPHVMGRLWCVFGCGGDRDRGKRAEMGRIAIVAADCVVVTSDNPRSEPAEQIIDDVLLGIDALQSVCVEPDRAAAIAFAIERAEPGDLILLAGKGHEKFQLIAGQRLPFCDVDTAQRCLAARRSS